MKTVLQNVKTGIVSVDEIPSPILKPGNVLVRNVCSLVSAGTEKSILEFSKANYLEKARKRPDLVRKVLNRAKNDGLWQTYKIVSNLIDQPIQLGYSSAGIVVEVGDEVTDISVGQKVACAGLFVATHSEMVSVPRNLLVPLPDTLSFEEACFVTLGAISMQGVRLAGLELSDNVVVYGLGLVGMVAAQMAVAAGCRVIGVDPDPAKVELVNKFGCIGVPMDAEMERTILRLTDGYGADKVLLCAATKSNDPVERIPAITRQKGMVVVIGDVSMNIPRRAYYDKEIDIRISRSYGAGRYDPTYEEGGIDYPYAYVRWTENRNMSSVLDLATRGKLSLGELITHRFSIDDALKAYDIIEGKTGEKYLGIVIRYCEDQPQGEVEPRVTFNKLSGTHASGEISFGVIGAGNFAKAFLLPSFQSLPGVKFRGICTASGVSSYSVAKKYGADLATANPDEILDNTDINAVLIATRHDSHAKYVIRSLEAGKAVFVEKPLATNMPDLDQVKNTYTGQLEAGKAPFLMVGFNRRFSPLSSSLKQLFSVRSEPLSVIYRVNAGFVPQAEWVHDPVQGGGRVVGEVCHFIDFITYLVGELPTAVYATPMRKNGKAISDVVTISLQFANGSTGTIHYFSNGDPSMPKEYVEIFGGGISAQLTNFKKVKVYGAKIDGKTSYLNQAKGFEEEAQYFVEALKTGQTSPIPFDQIYAVSKATILAEQSMRTGTILEL